MCLDIVYDDLFDIMKWRLLNLQAFGMGRGMDASEIMEARDDAIVKVQSLITNAPATLGLPVAVKNMLWEELEPYFQGNVSLDEAIAAAQEKLEVYIAE